MKKIVSILCLFIVGCAQKETINKEKFVLPVTNYYQLQKKDIKTVDEVNIDSIVPITERKQLEEGIAANEKKYNFFVEAKDDEYADSTARDIEQMRQKLKSAENTTVLYYTVYHTVRFTDSDQVKRKRQSYFDITSDYKIKPNAVTEMDKSVGIKGEALYKRYSY